MGKNTQGFQNIKDKNYRGLLNQTKSNIPKEKENESKKEIEVITIKDDYEPEDFYCKLLCCIQKDHQNSNVDVSNSQAGSSNVINEKNMLDKKNTQGFQNIKDKNYRGLLNQTKSNIPKEKESESKKEIEV